MSELGKREHALRTANPALQRYCALTSAVTAQLCEPPHTEGKGVRAVKRKG